MARRIILKENGLLNSTSPNGYRYVGYEGLTFSENFGSTISNIGGGVDKVGDLLTLYTTNKLDAVSSINEIYLISKSNIPYNSYVIDQLAGSDTDGIKGKIAYQTIDAVVPLLSSGDTVYVRNGSYTTSTNLMVDGVTWIFEESGGSVYMNSIGFNDNGASRTTKVYAKNWDFNSFTYLIFQTGSSYLDITCKDLISSSNLAIFHASATYNNLLKVNAVNISGASYIMSPRGFSNGNITAERIYGSNAAYVAFFRNNGGDNFKGRYIINCPDMSCVDGGNPIYVLGSESAAYIEINGSINQLNGGTPIVWSGDGKLIYNGVMNSTTEASIYTNGSGEIEISGSLNISAGNSSAVYLDSYSGKFTLKNNSTINFTASVVDTSGILVFSVPTTKIILESDVRISTSDTSYCINLMNASDGKYIIENGVTLLGATAISCGVTVPDIVLKGLLLSNAPDDVGVTYAFDALLAAGATSGRVTNVLIE